MSEAKAVPSVATGALIAEAGAVSTLGAAFRRIRHLLEDRDLSRSIDRHEQDILDVARASLAILDELEEGRSAIWAARQLRDLLEKQLVVGCKGDIAATRIAASGFKSTLVGGSLLFAIILAVVMILTAGSGEADRPEFQKLSPMQLSTLVGEAGR